MAYIRTALARWRQWQRGGDAPPAEGVGEAIGLRPDQVHVAFLPQLGCETCRVTGLRIVTGFDLPGGGTLTLDEVQAQLPDDLLGSSIMAGFRLALTALRRWDRLGVGPGVLTLPLAPGALADGFLVQEMLWELDRQNIEPWRIEVEFLEPEGGDIDRLRVADGVQTLSRAGCRIAMGGFGSGGAPAEMLHALGVSRVRIGRRFVAHCDSRASQQQMILPILALAQHLQLETLADGVATAGERAFLTQIGLGAIQGRGVLPVLSGAAIDDILLGQRGVRPLAIPLRNAG